MTVKKLKWYLENLPEDATVMATDPENSDDWNEITSVIVDKEGDIIFA